MTPTDVALLDEAHWLIDPGFRRFGHVVVDEAQNLTPMELRMTVRRARGQSLTILGDLSQRTADAGVSSLGGGAGRGGRRRARRQRAERSATACRTSSWCSPGALLPAGAPAPRGVREAPFAARSRSRPTTSAPPRRAWRRGWRTRSAASAWSRRTACIDAVRAALDGTFVGRHHGAALGPGVNLLDLHVAKGLEFDAIVVVEPAAILAERPDGGVGGLYTALTRATRALAIVHAQPLPEALRKRRRVADRN